MNKSKYYILVFATKADRKAGEYAYEFDCSTLEQADRAADDEIKLGNYAASIYERSGTTAPSVRVSTHLQPQTVAA